MTALSCATQAGNTTQSGIQEIRETHTLMKIMLSILHFIGQTDWGLQAPVVPLLASLTLASATPQISRQ